MKINPVYFENNWGKFTKFAIGIVIFFSIIALYRYSQLTDADVNKWEKKEQILRDSLEKG